MLHIDISICHHMFVFAIFIIFFGINICITSIWHQNIYQLFHLSTVFVHSIAIVPWQTMHCDDSWLLFVKCHLFLTALHKADILHTVHYTLHSQNTYCTLHTAHYTLHTAYYTLYTLYIAFCTLRTTTSTSTLSAWLLHTAYCSAQCSCSCTGAILQ